MKNILIVILLIPLFLSCQALKKSICDETYYDTVTFVKHIPFYDTVKVPVNDSIRIPVYDTTKILVHKEIRDTLAVFKGIKIFFCSSVDSLSSKDSLRYLEFEVCNYGNEDYKPNEDSYYVVILDLEVNKVVMFNDTLLLDTLKVQDTQTFKFKFSNRLLQNSDGEDYDFHYQLLLKDSEDKLIDAFYPRQLNPKMPEKRYDEVTEDTIIYWQRPIIEIVDSNITVKNPVFAYKDSLIFIDDIIGCEVYSHIFFGGNKIFSFVTDTCTKRLYSNMGMTDSYTEGISAMILRATTTDPGALLKVFVNDSLFDSMPFNEGDSTYVFLIPQSFRDIKSVKFSSLNSVTIHAALLNNVDLLSKAASFTGNVAINDKAGFTFTPVAGSLIGNWKFNGNFNDLSGNGHTGTLSGGAVISTTNALEGSGSLSLSGSTAQGIVGVIDCGDKYTIAAWVNMTMKANIQSIISNAESGAPKIGYKLLINTWNTTDRKIHFQTGDGTTNKNMSSGADVFEFDKWSHIAVTVDNTTKSGRIYYNGIDVTVTPSILPSNPVDAVTYLGIMKNNAWPMTGKLDDVRIYNKILTPAEIQQVFNKQDLPGSNIENAIKFTLP